MRPPSPVKAAVLAALPAGGEAITRKALIAAVHARCPVVAVATIANAIQDLAVPPRGMERCGPGLYRRSPPA